MINLWAAVAAAAIIGVTNFASFSAGKESGVKSQQAVDQVKYDDYAKDIAEQKLEADSLYREAQANVIAAMSELDKFKTTLENERAKSNADIELMRRNYASLGLRFTTTAKAAGCGSRSTGTNSTEGAAPGAAETVSIQLPAALAANLRQLALDADTLNSEYGICYKYINR